MAFWSIQVVKVVNAAKRLRNDNENDGENEDDDLTTHHSLLMAQGHRPCDAWAHADVSTKNNNSYPIADMVRVVA